MIQMMHMLCRLSILLLCVSTFGMYNESDFESLDYSPPVFTVTLPINIQLTKKKHIQLSIPARFQFVSNEKDSQNYEIYSQEYFVWNYQKKNWSEDLIIRYVINQKLHACQMTDSLRDRLLSYNGRIFAYQSELKYGYAEYTLIMVYDSPDIGGRKEMMIAQYFSGLSDCFGIQYTVPVDDFLNINDAVSHVRDVAYNILHH